MNYTELLNPRNSAVIFIDFQPQMVFGVANTRRAAWVRGIGCDCFAF